MLIDHRARVEDLMADYRHSRERLATTQRGVSSIAETVRSEDGSIDVVVGPQGVLRDLIVSHDGYERELS